MGAAEEDSIGLDAVPDDLASAVIADRGKHLNGALEAVENVAIVGDHHLESTLVIVAAKLALGHGAPLFSNAGGPSLKLVGRAP
jgi:hypothetical protein